MTRRKFQSMVKNDVLIFHSHLIFNLLVPTILNGLLMITSVIGLFSSVLLIAGLFKVRDMFTQRVKSTQQLTNRNQFFSF